MEHPPADQCPFINRVAIRNVEINGSWHRPEITRGVAHHEHRIADAHFGMHHQPVRTIFARDQFAAKGRGKKLNQVRRVHMVKR